MNSNSTPRRSSLHRDNPPLALSAAVLAGGASTRMGIAKGLLEVQGRPLISRVTDVLSSISDDVLCVTCEPEHYRFEAGRLRFTPDEGGDPRGPLSGIVGALAAARHELCIVVALDMPFLNAELLCSLARRAGETTDVVLPLIEGDRPESMHAVYRRTCLAPARAALAAGQKKVTSFFEHVEVMRVPPEALSHIEGYRRSFINVNTPEELEAARDNNGH